MEEKSGIYTIENLTNGKKYIGQTKNINRRWREHLGCLKGNRHSNSHLQRAFNKYGEDNMSFSVIEMCKEDELDTKESDYIKLFDSMKSGYNLRAGGSRPRLSIESRRLISKTRTERLANGKIIPAKHKWTQEQKDRQSVVQQKLSIDNPERRVLLSITRSTISTDVVKRIKTLLYIDMHVDDIADITGVDKNKIQHIDSGKTFSYVYPGLNSYIKSRYIISKLRKQKSILKGFMEGNTYQEIADSNNIDIRNVIRILNKAKTRFNETMRNNALDFKATTEGLRVMSYHNKGYNYSQIATRTSVTRSKASRIINNRTA